MQSIPKNLSGDFGENVAGGRDEYMVLWDVLKDVDEVKSVDFAVKAELIKDDSPGSAKRKQIKWADKKFYVIVAGGEGKGVLWGPQFGTIQNVGDNGGDFIFIKRKK